MESAVVSTFRPSLLLIEDNPGDARLVREALKDGRDVFELDWAEHLQSGLQRLNEKPIDLVLLDLSLPDTEGLTTVRRVLAHSPEIPVIVLTGTKDESLAAQALQIGAQDYLSKDELEGRLLHRSIRYAMERAREAQRYRDLFENANDIVCTLDLEGRFTSVNRRGEQVLGYLREELLGMNLLELTPENIECRELEAIARDGTRIPLEVSARIIHEEGKATGIQAILRDIRNRRRLEADLSQANKMDALGRLAGGVAHDFNNLLTVIGGHAHLSLSRGPESSQAKDDLLQIISAVHRAAALTRQLLAFSRKRVIQPKILDVDQVVSELGRFLKRLIGENIELKIRIAPELGRTKADRTQIEQVIMNLALNARDAMPDGGILIIEGSNTTLEGNEIGGNPDVTPGDYVIIAVTDTGTGMDLKTQERIFEPFFTTKGQGKGTGLGLALVYGVVKQVGGHILVYSEPGHGTTFKVYLPRIFEESPSAEKQAASQPARLATETVMIVEDETSLRSLLEAVLKSWGYNVLVAAHGNEALTVSSGYPGNIHLVITDMVMPGMSGQELVAKLRATRPESLFLYVSGYPGDIALKNGAIDDTPYLQKPFGLTQLADRLRQLLDHGK